MLLIKERSENNYNGRCNVLSLICSIGYSLSSPNALPVELYLHISCTIYFKMTPNLKKTQKNKHQYLKGSPNCHAFCQLLNYASNYLYQKWEWCMKQAYSEEKSGGGDPPTINFFKS